MLSGARAAIPLKTTSTDSRSRTKSPSGKSKPPQASARPAPTTTPECIDPAKLATLQSYSRKLNEGLHQQGWMQVKTLRFRPKGENIDRKFVVESSLDPMDNSAVILRVRPAGWPRRRERHEVFRMRSHFPQALVHDVCLEHPH